MEDEQATPAKKQKKEEEEDDGDESFMSRFGGVSTHVSVLYC